jgi:hypothetical protein
MYTNMSLCNMAYECGMTLSMKDDLALTAMLLLYVVQPSALGSMEYFLGDVHDTAEDRIAAWIPRQREQQPC